MIRKFLIPFLLLIGFYANAQTDNSLYKLSVKKGKFVKIDSISYLEVPVTLTNTAKDTLYYLSMSCSWQDYYSVTSNPEILKVEEVPCEKTYLNALYCLPAKAKPYS